MRFLTPMVLVGLVPLAGCQQQEVFDTKEQHQLRVTTVQMLNNMSIDNGIVAQHTLYPYHFESDAAQLNALGERDIDVLAAHFRKHPGEINVLQGTASDQLYADRLRAVSKYLADTGVKMSRVTIADGLPGGPGLASDNVIHILETEREAGDAGGGFGSNSMGSSQGDPYVDSNR